MSQYPQSDLCFASTHIVENMPPLLQDYNVFDQDIALKQALKRGQAEWSAQQLHTFGQQCGSLQKIEWGLQANRQKPVLMTHDRYGNRVDLVEFHPAYHQLMADSIKQGFHCSPWREPKLGAHVARAAGSYLQAQVEAGHGCPITMTFACFPTLLKQPEIAKAWLPLITTGEYDSRNIPWFQKKGVTIGMAMTEKQGGSDVRTNSTIAHPIAEKGPGQRYELVGHKYFVSAPMSDAFLMLAQTDGGISCFLVPRWRPDGSKNPLQLIQLKDKMGNASNASSETELRGAFGWMMGEEGRGIANILEMVSMTRFDCMVASAGAMRQAVSQATHHCHYRSAFGKALDKQPLMQNVLADLVLESEAAVAIALGVAAKLDQAQSDDEAKEFVRIANAIGKFWVCKRTPAHAYEAMECIGGSGVMENCIMPRLYREAPINTIWEGSGNVQCLDVLRAMQKSPRSLEAFMAELATARGLHKNYDLYFDQLHQTFKDQKTLEYRARSVVEQLALSFQAATLLRSENFAVAEAFCQARLSERSGLVYGTLAREIDCEALIERARPNIS